MMTETNTKTDGGKFKAYEIQPGQVYRTSGGERVEIISEDGPFQKPMKVRFPEREPQLDADGNEQEHIQFQSRHSFADAANFDGYELITEDGPTEDTEDEDAPEDMTGEWTEDCPPRCPVCARFMSTGFDGMGHPSAQCSRLDCHGFMDDRELIDGGYFEPASED